jgi:hypothetical protein
MGVDRATRWAKPCVLRKINPISQSSHEQEAQDGTTQADRNQEAVAQTGAHRAGAAQAGGGDAGGVQVWRRDRPGELAVQCELV